MCPIIVHASQFWSAHIKILVGQLEKNSEMSCQVGFNTGSNESCVRMYRIEQEREA